MGCSLHTLAGLPQSACETNLTGIKKAYIANYENVASVAISGTDVETSYVITAITMTGSTKFYAYNFAKQTGSLTSTLTKDETNGTKYYTNVAALQFSKMEARKHLEFAALAADPTALIVEDNNGVFHYVSLDQYLRAQDGASAATGQSYDDDNQYEVILSGRSGYPSIIFEKSVAEGVIDNLIVGA